MTPETEIAKGFYTASAELRPSRWSQFGQQRAIGLAVQFPVSGH